MLTQPLSCSFRPPRLPRARRRGISLWLFALSLPIIFGVCGLAIDLGQLHARRSQAQRAADASALAGAQVSSKTNELVIPTATNYALINGFSAAKGDTVTVTPFYDSKANDNRSAKNTVRVQIVHREPVYFAPVAETLLSFLGWSDGAAQFSRVIGTQAVARKLVPLQLKLGGNYGVATGSKAIVNNVINGPAGAYDDGDPFSPLYNLDGTPNDDNKESGGYQDFTFDITEDYLKKYTDKRVAVQIFSPGSADSPYDGYTRQTPVFPDGVTPPSWALTTTQYQILKGDTLIASAQYGAVSGKNWVTPDGFNIDLDTSSTGPGQYKIRVKALSGNTLNDYVLRAGPTAGTNLSDQAWNDTYGDKLGADTNNIAVPINSQGHIAIGFQVDGTAALQLGYLDSTFAGKTVYISHFDLDINARSLSYSVDSLPGTAFAGTLPQNSIAGNAPQRPGNGIWATDTIKLPDDFSGGNLAANYTAGVSGKNKDGSSWKLYGEGDGAGEVRLIE